MKSLPCRIALVLVATFASSISAHAKATTACMTEASEQYQSASAQFKAHKITLSQWDLERVTYVNQEYACHVVSQDVFCSQVPALIEKTMAQIEKDYPDTDERSAILMELLSTDASVTMECLP